MSVYYTEINIIYRKWQINFLHLFQALVQLTQNAALIEHLALVSMFVIIGDPLPHGPRKLSIDHIFLHLFELENTSTLYSENYSRKYWTKKRVNSRHRRSRLLSERVARGQKSGPKMPTIASFLGSYILCHTSRESLLTLSWYRLTVEYIYMNTIYMIYIE